MDRAPARRGRAAGDRTGSSRAPPNGARPRRRPPRPPPAQHSAPRPRARPKNRARKRPPQPTIAVKLIVRRLPPTLTAEEFSSHADPNGADKAIWTKYYPGKVEAVGAVKRSAQVVRHSVAYLAFEKLEDATNFFQQFDAFKFADNAKTVDSSLQSGTDYYARVERAMYQPTPPLNRRRPPSPLEGTIESDPDYLRFLAELKGEAEREQNELTAALASASTIVSRPSTNENDKSNNSNAKKQVVTPLMEDVRARRRERDERKKAKATARGGRGKPRGNAPPPPPPPPANKSNEHAEPNKLGARRKKRRGGENANTSKRDEPVQDRKSSKSPSNERRNGQLRPVENNAAAPANSINSSPYVNSTASMNGASNGKGGSSRGGSGGRSRYARGQKGRGRYGQNGNGTVGVSARNEHPSSDALHGPVRVLRKEASVTNKT